MGLRDWDYVVFRFHFLTEVHTRLNIIRRPRPVNVLAKSRFGIRKTKKPKPSSEGWALREALGDDPAGVSAVADRVAWVQ